MPETEGRTKQSKLIKTAFREAMKDVCTSIPGHVTAFDPKTQLAQVQVGVMRVDINGAEFEIPPIIQVPVLFPGGDYLIEYQIDPGCEGNIHFSQRCIDGWKQSGKIAANPIGRFHSMQDALFIPGFRSQPNTLPAFENNGVRLRDRSGGVFVWLRNDNTISMQNGAGSFELQADGTFIINGLQITPAGDVITATGISLNNHRTSGVTRGNQISDGPIV